MTKEEVIFCEKSYIGETNCTDCNYYGTDTCQSRVSHKMAIKALEQEPSVDCASRKAVDTLSKELVHTTRDKADFICNFWERLQKLPPVTPTRKKGKWIENNKGVMICSCCNTWFPKERKEFMPNCPYCMAEMESE